MLTEKTSGGLRTIRNHKAVRFTAAALAAGLAAAAAVQTIRLERMKNTVPLQMEELSAQVLRLTARTGELAEENRELQAQISKLRGTPSSFPYQEKYPEMAVQDVPAYAPDPPSTVYLTFDDGPSDETAGILDALKAQDAKATFFIIGVNIPGHEDMLKRMVDEGHTVAIHTNTHQYREIYASVDAYLDDFHEVYTEIHDVCGVYPSIFRFPGGSINSYNRGTYQEIIAEMVRRGFIYYDWNVSPENAFQDPASIQLAGHVAENVGKQARPIVLMHDSSSKPASAQAVPAILARLKAEGFTFAPLTNRVHPIVFGYQ